MIRDLKLIWLNVIYRAIGKMTMNGMIEWVKRDIGILSSELEELEYWIFAICLIRCLIRLYTTGFTLFEILIHIYTYNE